jgi:RNA polymerase sigma-70 factor (ECF subfamily)
MSDLVERARAGDKSAFERLYREHADRVHGLCLRLTGDVVRAEEHTQDTFVNAWHRLSGFRGDASFSSWLHRIAVNSILQARRSEKRRRARVQSADPAALESMGRAARAGLGIDLERAIASLPEGARSVFILHDVEGYKHSEIAEMAGTAVGTVKAQLHRARRLLRERLER